MLKGHSFVINCLSYNIEGDLLFSGSSGDESLKIWNTKTFQNI